MQFVVLSSSRGTTFQAVIDAMASGELTAECLGLVTDRLDRACIQKAEAAGIPVKIVEKRDDESREDYDVRLDQEVRSLGEVDYIAALGWMFIFGEDFISQWNNKIINVHPALLPKYGGKGMYGHHVHTAVLANNESESGITIHYVDEGVDTGEILLQQTCPILEGDTPVSLQERVQELEKQWYPVVLQQLTANRL